MTQRSARQAATAHLQHAEVAINAMFDRQDDVEATLAQIAQIATSDTNVFTRAQSVADKTAVLTAQIGALRDAAVEASAHRAKRDLAKDLSASPTVVFHTPTPTGAPAAVVDESANPAA